MCGSGFGTVIFAPLTQYLIVEYQWQGTLIFIAGVTFFCAVFGWMFRPLNLDEYEQPALTEPESPTSNNNNNNNNCIKYKETIAEGEDKNLLALPTNSQFTRSLSFGHESHIPKAGNGTTNGKVVRNGEEKNRLALSMSQPLLNDPRHIEKGHLKPSVSGTLDRPDAFYTGSLHNIARQRSQLSLHGGDKYGSMRLRKNNNECEQTEVCGCIPCSQETHDTLKKMMSFGLFKDPVFILFVLSNFLTR